ncbi:MAG: tetratricopeptide repeat protein, partial [Myxococcales bacterium]|nr:tetratricopeptide repeat protein [Myxococcales bacterium]
LDRVLQKYRRDVHELGDPASDDAIAALESHLGRRLPAGLRTFLLRHNGAALFRGSLRLRNTSEIAPAGDQHGAVFLFADHHDDTSWAWGRNHDGSHAFGAWDGEQLEPLHATFFGWLDATLEVLDARVSRPEDRDAIRFEADANDPWQLLFTGMKALEQGRPEEATPLLERATRVDPSNVLAWQRLGDALAVTDRVASRRAWLRALHQLRLPLPWPGAPCLDPEVLGTLSRSFTDPEQWERELERFLEERVHEVRTDAEFDFLVAATTALADSLARRGRRSAARDVLAELVTRSTLFEVGRVPWTALRTLAELEVGLGHHDEAEKHIRRLRAEGPPRMQALALVQLARLVVMREEPWAEEILAEAATLSVDDDTRIEIALVTTERHVRHGRLDEARESLERAQQLV